MIAEFLPVFLSSVVFFNAPAHTGIYTLSLHDALPILNQILAWRKRWHAFLQNSFEFVFDLRDDRRKRAAAVARLVFDSIPAIWIVARSDDYPTSSLLVPHQKRDCRCGARLVS